MDDTGSTGRQDEKGSPAAGPLETKAALTGCGDNKCPFHGSLKLRGKRFDGVVVSDRMQGTAVVEWDRVIKVKKYDRFMRKSSRVKAHNPACIKAKKGDRVRIAESRRLSKTVGFVIIEKLG